MHETTAHSPLWLELPDELFWLEVDICALQRTAAFARTAKGELKPGATRRSGIDLPADADWARGRRPEDFYVHHQDGESFCLQLNLADIPSAVRKPEWPSAGVLWVFLERGKRNYYEVTVRFDPRPAGAIPWRSLADAKGTVTTWCEELQLPWATETTLPMIANWPDMCSVYDDWAQRFNEKNRRCRGLTLGGYAFTNQGDFDEDSKEFVLAIEDLYFGDCGEVYVFFNPERGFYGRADIC